MSYLVEKWLHPKITVMGERKFFHDYFLMKEPER